MKRGISLVILQSDNSPVSYQALHDVSVIVDAGKVQGRRFRLIPHIDVHFRVQQEL
jgi:hypothetical protein